MPRATVGPTAGYEVAVPGSLAPGHRAALTAGGTFDVELTTMFQLSLPAHATVREVVEALEARGMVIRGIRRLRRPEPHRVARNPERGERAHLVSPG